MPARRPGWRPDELDAVAYSYDPDLAFQPDGDITAASGRACARSTPGARRSSCRPRCPGWTPAACAGSPTTSPTPPRPPSPPASTRAACSCSTGAASARRTSPAARAAARWRCSPTQELPHSLGLLYEELTAHLGFRRSSDEYKVMAMASYGAPRVPRRLPRAGARRRRGGFRVGDVDLGALRPAARARRRSSRPRHADLAATVQRRLEEVLLDLARLAARAHGRPRPRDGRRRRAQLRRQLAALARGAVRAHLGAARGGRLRHGARGGAARRARARRRRSRRWRPPRSAAAGTTPRWPRGCETAGVAYERPDDVADAVAEALAANQRRGLVPGALRVRAARARAPLAAGRSARRPRTSRGSTTSRAASSSGPSRPWCSPSGRAEIFDGRPDPEPVHALHPPRAAGLGRADPRRRARRRDGADPDRRPRGRSR